MCVCVCIKNDVKLTCVVIRTGICVRVCVRVCEAQKAHAHTPQKVHDLVPDFVCVCM